jgi:hypothetical protein
MQMVRRLILDKQTTKQTLPSETKSPYQGGMGIN